MSVCQSCELELYDSATNISAVEGVLKCVSNVMLMKIQGTFERKLVGFCATFSWNLHALQVCCNIAHQYSFDIYKQL